MTYTIAEPCVDIKDKACIEECPVDCIYEDIDYARRLSAAGVATELHVHPGCPHAFEGLAPGADVSRRVIADRVRRLRSL